MAKLKSLNNIPPGGWRYLQPTTLKWFSSTTWGALVSEVTRHREYKGIDATTVSEDIQDQLCLSLTGGECRAKPGEEYIPVFDRTQTLTPGMVLSLSKGLLAFILKGAKWVDKEEADRRADICRGCPFNKPAALCSCSSAYKAINQAVPEDRIPKGVDVCMACGCSLKAKINLPLSVISASVQKGQEFPPHCWQLEALEK
tara:strand:+ start:4089 stop:4688 length:600 start_codon:yes stop_codon:yes gene_type:complete